MQTPKHFFVLVSLLPILLQAELASEAVPVEAVPWVDQQIAMRLERAQRQAESTEHRNRAELYLWLQSQSDVIRVRFMLDKLYLRRPELMEMQAAMQLDPKADVRNKTQIEANIRENQHMIVCLEGFLKL